MGGDGSGRHKDVATILKEQAEKQVMQSPSEFVIPNLSGMQDFAKKDNTSCMKITNDGTKTTLLGTAGDYNRIGDARVTYESLSTNDDLLVTGKLEVGGSLSVSAVDAAFQVRSPVNYGTVAFKFIEETSMIFKLSARPAYDQMSINIDPKLGSQLLIINNWDWEDYDHPVQTNPTLYIQSATSPNTDNTQWLSLTHNQTNGVIDVGLGNTVITRPQASDHYHSSDGSSGATGSFTTVDLKTVTVKDGIITAIV